MKLLVYPYTRIITLKYLQNKGLSQPFIDDVLEGLPHSILYQAGFPHNNLRIMGEKNEPIEKLIEKLEIDRNFRKIRGAKKVVIVHHSQDYKEFFAPTYIELGEIEELGDEDYKIFVDGIQKIMNKKEESQ